MTRGWEWNHIFYPLSFCLLKVVGSRSSILIKVLVDILALLVTSNDMALVSTGQVQLMEKGDGL